MIAKKTIFAAATAAVMALPASGALAQSQQNPNAAYTQEAPAANTGTMTTTVDEKTMAEFAKVHPEVEKVNRAYAEKIRAETSAEARNKLAAEANKEIENLIGDSDLSVQEYNRLSMLIQQDAGLQKEYHRALNK